MMKLYIFLDASWTVCSSVFWIPAAGFTRATRFSFGWLARRFEPSETEAIHRVERRQRKARRGDKKFFLKK